MEIIKKTIGEIASLIKTGKTPPSKEERYYNGNINWYTPGDLDKEKFLGKSNRTITEEAVAENKATLLPKNIVVIGAIGDIGKLGITSIESCTNQQITGIRTNEEVYFEYFYYWLKANRQLLKSNAKNAILPILNNESIRAIKIQFPKDIDDQKRIAKVLSQCESLIQKRKKSIDLLHELLKSTFWEMFKHREGEEIALEKIIDIQEGLINPNDEPYREMFHVGGANIESNTGSLINLKKAKDEHLISGKYLFEPGYILYSKIRPYLNKVALMNFTGICSADIYPIKPKNPVLCNVQFLRFELQTKKFLNHADSNSGRANIPKINRKELNAYKVILPDPELQAHFAEIVERTNLIGDMYSNSLVELENLYGSICQRAFNGKLDLSKVDISDMDDSKKKETETVKEDLTDEQIEELINSFEHTLPDGEVPSNRETDIRNMSIRQYLGYPEYDELTEGIEFSKMNKDYFYQFILTQGFADRTFTLPELEQYARKYILRGTGFEFTYDNWKTILFRFIGAKQPIIEQVFDENDKTIKLKLTDEAFKV